MERTRTRAERRRIEDRCDSARPGICFLDIGGDAPGPDPNIGIAARENAALAREMAGVAREELAFNRQKYEENAPLMQEAANLSIESQRKNVDRADEQWKRYQDIFAPVEEQMAQEAMAFGSKADQEAEATAARAGVARSMEGQRGQLQREMARMGVNPGSPAYMAALAEGGTQQAAAEAGAMNNARRSTRLQGMALRQGVAQFGRNMPSTGLASDSAALAGGQAGTSILGQQAAIRNQGTNVAINAYQGAQSGFNSEGQLGLGITQAKQQQQQANFNQTWQNLTGLGMLGGLAFSSKKLKEDMRKLAAQGVLEKVKRIPVEEWKYKKGVADEGKHIGPYAEDVHREFGDKAAPKGRMIDLISMNGIALAAIKAVAEKVDKLAAKVEPEGVPA